MWRIGSLTEVNGGGRDAVPKTMRPASPTAPMTIRPATTLAIHVPMCEFFAMFVRHLAVVRDSR